MNYHIKMNHGSVLALLPDILFWMMSINSVVALEGFLAGALVL